MCRLEIFTCVILTAFLCAYFQHIGAYFMFIIITAEWVWVWVRILFFSRFCIFMIFFYVCGTFSWGNRQLNSNSSSCLLESYRKLYGNRKYTHDIVQTQHPRHIFSDYSYYNATHTHTKHEIFTTTHKLLLSEAAGATMLLATVWRKPHGGKKKSASIWQGEIKNKLKEIHTRQRVTW